SVEFTDQIKATSPTTPQSPYVCYPDLKPPTSPTPTPSIGLNVDSSTNTMISSPLHHRLQVFQSRT
ncbi:hypothetical protein M569_04413, partial [Genlisea aurea]